MSVHLLRKHQQAARLQKHGTHVQPTLHADLFGLEVRAKGHHTRGLQTQDGHFGRIGEAVHVVHDALSGGVVVDQHLCGRKVSIKDVVVDQFGDEQVKPRGK